MFVPELEGLVPLVRPSKSKLTEIVKSENAIDPLLFSLLELRTPHGAERPIIEIIAKHISSHLRMPEKCLLFDGHEQPIGNIIVYVGNKDKHKTLFSCHMDTVHKDYGRNRLFITDSGFLYACSERGEPVPLGADDKAGAWIMCKMIERQVPGLYVFHFGEEQGRRGSKRFVLNNRKLLGGIDRAVAFDRKGYGDIITHQLGEETCSSEFAKALAEQLNEFGSTEDACESWMPDSITWRPDDTGLYTDTYTYRGIVPECTNISIGYHHQHSKNECLDTYLLHHFLVYAFIGIKWDELPTIRKVNKAAYGRKFKQVEPRPELHTQEYWSEKNEADKRRAIADRLIKRVGQDPLLSEVEIMRQGDELRTSRATEAGEKSNVYKMYPAFDPDVGDPVDDLPRFEQEDQELAGEYKEHRHNHLWEKVDDGTGVKWRVRGERLREQIEREKVQQVNLSSMPDTPVTPDEYDLWKDGLAQGKTRKEQLDLIYQWILARPEAETSAALMRLLLESKENWKLKQFAEEELIKARVKVDLLPGQDEYCDILNQMAEMEKQNRLLENANKGHLQRLKSMSEELANSQRVNKYLNESLQKQKKHTMAEVADINRQTRQVS